MATIDDRAVYVDPVSHEYVEPGTEAGKSFYNGKTYHFKTRTNLAVFREDPQLWVPTPHATMVSSSLDPTDDSED